MSTSTTLIIVFQSTPSVGRATHKNMTHSQMLSYFNPRPPWGGRRSVFVIIVGDRSFQSTPSVGRATWCYDIRPQALVISIHALRGEGDLRYMWKSDRERGFQSTPSVGRATRAEHQTTPTTEYFNPRPPWGGRLLSVDLPMRGKTFQSTPSVGRATNRTAAHGSGGTISIHALRGEGDRYR